MIIYVELSARHIFICSTTSLRIFSREDGRAVLDIASIRDLYADWKFDPTRGSPSRPVHSSGVLAPYAIYPRRNIGRPSHPRRDQFIAGMYFVPMVQGFSDVGVC